LRRRWHMVKRLTCLVFCLFLLGGAFVRTGYCKFECQYDPPHSEMKGGIKYWCTCHSSYIKCESQESASSTMPYRGGLSPSQQMAVVILAAMLQSVFSGMFDDLIAPPRLSNNDALIRQQQKKLNTEEKLNKMKEKMQGG